MKRWLKYLSVAVVLLLILINSLIAIHSYGFTHLSEDAPPLKPKGLNLTFSEKVKLALTGIDIPKPKATEYPKEKYEDILIPVDADKNLSAWLIRTDSLKHGIAIIFHGYIDQKSSMLDRAEELMKMGYDVLLVDFMGSGNSYGEQTTIGYLESENVRSAYDYVSDQLQEKNIVLFGFSMGAAAIAKAQHDNPMNVSAIILEAPYATFEETVANRVKLMGVPLQPTTKLFTFWIGIMNGFNAFSANPIEYVESINIPTLLMCGRKDQYIPEEETEAIFESIGSHEKYLHLFENSTHESYLLKHREEWLKTVSAFLLTLKKDRVN